MVKLCLLLSLPLSADLCISFSPSFPSFPHVLYLNKTPHLSSVCMVYLSLGGASWLLPTKVPLMHNPYRETSPGSVLAIPLLDVLVVFLFSLIFLGIISFKVSLSYQIQHHVCI